MSEKKLSLPSVPPFCLDLIKKWESFKSAPYLCSAGYPTIGYGFRYYADGSPVRMKDPDIGIDTADYILMVLVSHFWDYVDSLVKPPLNDNQMAALTSFAYNVGSDNLRKSTLLKLVNILPENPKIRDEFARWNKAGGNTVRGLTNRRIEEANLYFKKP
jgi:lysozyme